jgi:hypothetical protein
MGGRRESLARGGNGGLMQLLFNPEAVVQEQPSHEDLKSEDEPESRRQQKHSLAPPQSMA